jgi:opacity protein-like surface antigen
LLETISVMRPVFTLAVCALALLAPRTATADILLTPFAGVSFLTDSDKKLVYGAGIALGGLIGLEAEVARTTLSDQNLAGVVDLETSLTTGMVNLMVRVPAGPVQPYVTGGLGVMRVSGDLTVPVLGSLVSLSGSEFAMNAGGGLYLFPSDHIGFRGDVRYFRTLSDLTIGDLTDFSGIDDLPLPSLDFWRVTAGVTLRF